MFIVPFFKRDPPPSLIQWSLQPMSLFLENRGKSLCSITDTPEDWLAENGLIVDNNNKWLENNIYYVQICPKKTNLKDFYSFEQVTKVQGKGTEECWRTFHFLNEPIWDGFVSELGVDSDVLDALKSIYSYK